MRIPLKPIHEQTIVVTGATSGIGLVTARTAARRGARVVLAARNDEALNRIADEINASGGQALPVVADVASFDDCKRVSEAAVDRFTSYDTWVNNAGVSIYGRCDEVSMEDHRRLFETNYWGVVHGSLLAVGHIKQRGGALINIGSVLSDRAIPLQGAYCASKHAVKGFTESLRMELEEAAVPVSVSLIKPATIDTPYPRHAKNYMPIGASLPPPVYAPELVAEAILHCAQHQVRDLVVGGGGKMMVMAGRYAPRLTDLAMERFMFDQQMSDEFARARDDNSLFRPVDDGQERGGYPGRVRETSLYTRAAMHPVASAVVLVGAGLAAAALLRSATHNGGDRMVRGMQRASNRVQEVQPTVR